MFQPGPSPGTLHPPCQLRPRLGVCVLMSQSLVTAPPVPPPLPTPGAAAWRAWAGVWGTAMHGLPSLLTLQWLLCLQELARALTILLLPSALLAALKPLPAAFLLFLRIPQAGPCLRGLELTDPSSPTAWVLPLSVGLCPGATSCSTWQHPPLPSLSQCHLLPHPTTSSTLATLFIVCTCICA